MGSDTVRSRFPGVALLGGLCSKPTGKTRPLRRKGEQRCCGGSEQQRAGVGGRMKNGRGWVKRRRPTRGGKDVEKGKAAGMGLRALGSRLAHATPLAFTCLHAGGYLR